MGDLSPNFSRREFTCNHCGVLVGPDPRLVAVLQRLRDATGRPLRVVSGTRCRTHNRTVGGSWRSQHLSGRAADLPGGAVTVAQALAAGAIGIGIRRDRVVHIDVRPGRRPFTFAD